MILRCRPPRFWLALVLLGFGAAWPLLSAAAAAAGAKRVYDAVRLTGEAPVIDGLLDEACWAQAAWAGDYRQREPFEGAAPTHPTQLKILYDNRNLYVAIRATDPGIADRPRLLGTRDEFSGEMVGIAFDSYLNRRTAFEFDVTSGGTKVDLILRNDGSIDRSWNVIWDVKVAVDAEGWTAEYRIPLSQLRYPRGREQVWGLHSWRWLSRQQEESNWQLIPMDHRGVVREFGELRGIRDLPPSRRIELMPYVVGSYESLQKEAGNPYRSKDEAAIDGGLDAKIGLASDFTLDLTVNPDFGQVDADPSEINLSTVETFFSEKRPFFIEGKAVFEYSLDDDMPFYSRRIGDGPSLTPVGPGFVKMPRHNSIVAAEKVTGRTAGGLSVGVLHALTERAEARIFDPDSGERRAIVEPRTNYVVARVQNDSASGDTTIGGIITATQREATDEELSFLPRRALTGGVDALQYWNQRTYFLDARALWTRQEGTPEAVTHLMSNMVHNFDRVDAEHLDVDPDAVHLSGNGGRVRAGKGNGRWRYQAGASWRSPGVDFNDVGYLATADYVRYSTQLQYYNAEPGRWFRRREVRLRQISAYNYDRETLYHNVGLQAELASLRNWFATADLRLETARLDTRVLRGGPALRRPTRIPLWFYTETDGGRPTQFRLSGGASHAPADGSRYFELEPKLVRRFGDRWRVDASVGYSRNQQASQYAGQAESPAGTRYLMGRMEQQTLWSELRVQANFSPVLSLTYFAGPYASVGRFDAFKLVTQPRATREADRFAPLTTVRTGETYATAHQGLTFQFDDPDFDWRELKSNLVLRWEFRPGSTLYCVWSQHRADAEHRGDFAPVDEYRQLLRSHPDNTFLVKMSYWFSI